MAGGERPATARHIVAMAVVVAMPGLRERLEATAAELWLNRWRQGRLSPKHLGCAAPRDVVALGAALGVALPPEPP
jgi:hypothetical protein